MLEKKITAAQLKELLKNIKTGQIVTATFSGEGVNNYGNVSFKDARTSWILLMAAITDCRGPSCSSLDNYLLVSS